MGDFFKFQLLKHNKTFRIVSFVIGQFENTSFLCWSQLGNGVREREVVGSPRDRVGLDALEPAC